MKKNFVKKTLASTLALAMVATATPAAFTNTASAAAAPKLNKSSKTLYINENEIGSTYDFNINNKVAGSTYKWTTSNKKVVTVNAKNGKVAAGTVTGKATITCKITLKTKKTKTLKATVTVKENATAVAISNVPTAEIGIGADAYDFNSTMTSASGAKATDYRVWEIATDGNTAGATIDAKNGKVTTTKAGEFKVRVRAYQNKTKLAANDTVDSEWLTVKVVPTLKSVAQSHDVKVALTYDDNMKDKFKTSDFVIKNKATNQVMTVKGISYSEDGKTVYVETYVSFADAATYVLTVDKKDFEFSTTVGAPASIEVTTTTAVISKPQEIKFVVKNANGIDISSTTSSKVTITEVDNKEGYLNGKNITIYRKDAVAKLKATYHSGEWNTDGTEKNKIEQEFSVTGVDATAATYGAITYTITDNASEVDMTKVTTPSTKIAVGDGVKYLHVNIKDNNNNTIKDSAVKFESGNSNVLLVSSNGQIQAVKPGVVAVLIKKDDKVIGTVEVTVLAERKAAGISLSTNEVTLSNVAASLTKAITVTVKDQHGDKIDKTGNYEVVGIDDKSKALLTDGKVTFNKDKVTIAPFGVAKDTYKFFVKAKNTLNGDTYQTVLTVNITNTTDTVAKSFRVELSDQTKDAVVTKADDANKNIAINISGFNASGDQVSVEDLTNWNLKVTNSNNEDVTAKFVDTTSATNYQFKVTSMGASNIVVKAPAGNYKVEFTKKTDSNVKAGMTITVTDTQGLPTVVLDKEKVDNVITTSTVDEVLKAAFVIKDANGVKLNDTGCIISSPDATPSVTVSDYTIVGTTLYVKKVKVIEKIADNLYVQTELTVERAVICK